MITTDARRMTAQGAPLDSSTAALGALRRSDDAATDRAELRRRLDSDGYFYLPGYLDRAEVLEARQDVLRGLAGIGALAPGTDPADAVPAEPFPSLGILSDLARHSEPLQRVLYGDRMISFYELFYDQPVRHYDFTWLRAVPPGRGTKPHGDSVFMNRGTQQLMTAWVPLGDVDVVTGGLVVLEGSHRLEDVRRDYHSRDVDTYCEDGEATPRWEGWISEDPQGLRAEYGLRWLTGDFAAGDLLTFTMHTLHGSLDNNSAQVRISTDSRYQPASEPADPRWVGARPSAHGPGSQRGLIC